MPDIFDHLRTTNWSWFPTFASTKIDWMLGKVQILASAPKIVIQWTQLSAFHKAPQTSQILMQVVLEQPFEKHWPKRWNDIFSWVYENLDRINSTLLKPLLRNYAIISWPGLNPRKTMVFQVIHCAFYCRQRSSIEFPSKGTTSSLLAICSDKEHNTCSQIPPSSMCALVWEAA